MSKVLGNKPAAKAKRGRARRVSEAKPHKTVAKKTVKQPSSTFDRMMEDADFKNEFDEGYKEFLVSELLIEIMKDDGVSVRG